MIVKTTKDKMWKQKLLILTICFRMLPPILGIPMLSGSL